MSTKPTTTKQPKGKAKPKRKLSDLIQVLTGSGAEDRKQTVPPVNIDKLLEDFKRLTPEQKSKVLTKLTRGLA